MKISTDGHASASPRCPTASASPPTAWTRSRPPRSASGSASARATSRPSTTASRICWSTWPSRAPSGAAPATSPRRSRLSAASSTPIPAREQTAYYAKVLTDDMPLAVDILADILQNSIFDADELTRERAVVLQEIGQAEDTPDDIIFDHFQETAFPDQAMGRPVLGRAEIVARPAARRRRRLHGEPLSRRAAWCWPPPASVDHDALVDLADEAVRRPADAATPRRPEPARYARRRPPRGARPRAGASGAGLRRRRLRTIPTTTPPPSCRRCSAAACPRACSRRSARSAAWSIRSIPSRSSYPDGGLFGIYAGTGEKEVAELMPVVCDELAKLPGDMTEPEVKRAAAQLKAAILMAREKPSARCEQLASQLLIYGRPIPPGGSGGAHRCRHDRRPRAPGASASRKSKPTLTALGPIGQVMEYDALARHGFPDAAHVRSRPQLCAAAAGADRCEGAPAPAALRRLPRLAGAARAEPRLPRAVGAGVGKRHADARRAIASACA